MNCPYCKKPDSRVVDTRASEDGLSIRRRRECPFCGKRFTTYEVTEKLPLMVVKHDGRREAFKREKILQGIIRSCQKRNISMERPSSEIGERVMQKLRTLDGVAYIRFASVYRKFDDISNFLEELKELQQSEATQKK